MALPTNISTSSQISAAVERFGESTDRHSRRLGTSAIAKPCDRAIWYGFRWAVKPKFEAKMRRLFGFGHWIEEKAEMEMRQAGLEVHVETPGQPGEQITYTYASGHGVSKLDGMLGKLPEAPHKWHVWECKSANDNRFKQFMDAYKKAGAKKMWDILIKKDANYWRKNWGQFIVEMELSNVDRALYTVINKNTSERVDIRMYPQATKARKLIERGENIIATDRPPDRIAEDPSNFQCKFCDYHSVCHTLKAPEVNCRTCSNATPVMDGNGGWHCQLHDVMIDMTSPRPEKGQPAGWGYQGCENHSFNPLFFSRYLKPTNADPVSGQIEYENLATGNRFINGYQEITSQEMHAVHDMNIIGDTFAESFREEFPGATYVG